MKLPIDLVQEFAKSTFDPGDKISETDCYGTAQRVDGQWYVRLDGSSELTPATVTTGVAHNDRVLVRIKNRKAVIVGNITNPVIMANVIKANTGIIVQGYLTTNEERTVYNDQGHYGLTFSSGGLGSYGGSGNFWYVTSSGDLYANSADIKGKITATSGFIGTAENGFTIDSTSIYSGIKGTAGSGYIVLSTSDVPRTVAGKSLSNLRFAIGSNFGVTADGTMYAQGANISGKITATSGYIGDETNGFKIDSSGFYSGANKTGAVSGYIAISNVDFARTIGGTARYGLRIAVGDSFAVAKNGTLYAAGANITGDITATSLTLAAGTKIPYSSVEGGPNVSIYIAKDGTIGTIAKGQDGFKVSSAGLLQASNAIIYGTIYASDGTIGGLTLKNNTLYTNSHTAWSTNVNGVYIGSDRIALGPNGKFNVTNAGVLTATGASISGDITANSLTLGTNVKVPYSKLENAPNLSVYISKDGTIGTVGEGSVGFEVSSAGLLKASNAVIYGKIYASEGTIGGLTLKNNVLYTNGHTAWSTNVNGVYIGSDRIALGPNGKFNVTNAGVLTATGATISGTITATEGAIGGLTLNNSVLYTNGHTAWSTNVNGVYIGSDRIALGPNGKFNVTNAGVLTATGVDISGKLTSTDADIKGKITASTGAIGGFTIQNNVLYTNGHTAWSTNANGVYIGADRIALGPNGKFNVTNAGVLTATGASITGSIHATTLTLDNKIPASDISGLPDLTLYIKKDGTIGTVADGSNGFTISSAGLLQASNAVIYGKIVSSTGKIGGFEIGSNKLFTTDHPNYDSNADGIFIGNNNLSFGKGGKFYIDKSGIVYCNGGTVYFNFTTANNAVSVWSNLIFRINKSTDVGGIGYNMSYITSGTTTTYYGDLYFYTTGANKNIYIKTYNNLRLWASNIVIGNTSANSSVYGSSAATSTISLNSSSRISFTTGSITYGYFSLSTSADTATLISTSGGSYQPNVFRTHGTSSTIMCMGPASTSIAPGVTPGTELRISMNVASPMMGLVAYVNGTSWYMLRQSISSSNSYTIFMEKPFHVTGGHITTSVDGTAERAFVTYNNYGRAHLSVYSDGKIGLYVFGYKNHDGETELYRGWMFYMAYDDSSKTVVCPMTSMTVNGKTVQTTSSDIRLKEKIKETEIKSGLSLINQIRLHSFTWKNSYNNELAGRRWKIGMIADELEELDPFLSEGGGWLDAGHTQIFKKSINTFYLQGYVIKAIQELSGTFESHESRIQKLEEENRKLKAELLKLKGVA